VTKENVYMISSLSFFGLFSRNFSKRKRTFEICREAGESALVALLSAEETGEESSIYRRPDFAAPTLNGIFVIIAG
jgi:hypothetical protein